MMNPMPVTMLWTTSRNCEINMENSDSIIERLMTVAKKWSWANPEVSDTCEKAAIHIQHLEARLKDRELWLKDILEIERELYKGSG